MDRPESPLALAPELPLRLNTLVMRMLAKEPAARPQTMEEVHGELIKCLKAMGTQVPPGEIAPAVPVTVPQLPAPAEEAASASAPSAPRTPSASASAPPWSPLTQGGLSGDTRFGLGGARLGLRGTQFLPPDEAGGAEPRVRRVTPSPTTFGDAVGESMLQPQRGVALRCASPRCSQARG